MLLKKFDILFLVIAFTLLIGGRGCANKNKDRDLLVSTSHQTIPSFAVKAEENEEAGITRNPFEEVLRNEDNSLFKYIKGKELITLNFGLPLPDSLVVEDSLLNHNGTLLLNPSETKKAVLIKEKETYSFQLDVHPSSGYSSQGNLRDIRGFKATASWGKEQVEWVFIVESDSSFGVHQ